MRMNWLLVLLLLFTPWLCAQQSPAGGCITGTVVNELNIPVGGASVSLQVIAPSQTQSYSAVQTDQSGRFVIQHVPLGAFGIEASKDDDGYPGSGVMTKVQTVTLTSEAPLANVIIKLGPRQAMLAPNVRDKATGKRICTATLHWVASGATEGGGPSSTSGGAGVGPYTTRISVPPARDVVLTATARGYKAWVYLDSTGHPSLNLQPGEVRAVDVELEPVPSQHGEVPRQIPCQE